MLLIISSRHSPAASIILRTCDDKLQPVTVRDAEVFRQKQQFPKRRRNAPAGEPGAYRDGRDAENTAEHMGQTETGKMQKRRQQNHEQKRGGQTGNQP